MQAQTTPPKHVERKYALTRLKAGDYLLPSNEGNTLWRIAKYVDGPSSGLTDWPADREFWGLWKLGPPPLSLRKAVETDEWDEWERWEDGFDTRQAAINAALRVES